MRKSGIVECTIVMSADRKDQDQLADLFSISYRPLVKETKSATMNIFRFF